MVSPRPDPQVGDLVVVDQAEDRRLGVVVEVINDFYWSDFRVFMSDGRTIVLGRSSMEPLHICDEE